METKTCKRCGIIKNKSEFHKNKSMKDGFAFYCKNCTYQINKNTNHLIKIRNINYYLKNKERLIKEAKRYREQNKEMTLQKRKTYYNKNKNYILKQHSEYKQKKRLHDINFKIVGNLRSRVSQAIKNNRKSKRTLALLGCSVEFLKQHLELQFKDGMTWNNYGRGWNGKGMQEWHVDHIKPCASFDLSKPEEQRKCFHYSNLQPLWAINNWSKNGY